MLSSRNAVGKQKDVVADVSHEQREKKAAGNLPTQELLGPTGDTGFSRHK